MSVISESDPRTIRATAGSTYGPAVLGQGSVEGRHMESAAADRGSDVRRRS
ncbi:hypothetical protein AAH978_01050 [Streptomyces sp. ZYX-F-203]